MSVIKMSLYLLSLLILVQSLFVYSIPATPTLSPSSALDKDSAADIQHEAVGKDQVAATPALDTPTSSHPPDHHNHRPGCNINATAAAAATTVSTLATATVTRHVKRAIVETETKILPAITSTVTATVHSSTMREPASSSTVLVIVTPTSTRAVPPSASTSTLTVIPAVAISNATAKSSTTEKSSFSSSHPVETVVTTTTGATSTSTTPTTTTARMTTTTTKTSSIGEQLEDLRKDFLTSLKETVRKVVTFSMGVMLSPFVIGAHRVPTGPITVTMTDSTSTPSGIESNQVDTN